jgi:hypothetical protein
MSKRRRRRSKRRKRKSSDGFGNASAKGKGSFIALVAGMMTTLLLAMGVYSYFFIEAPVARADSRPKRATVSLASKFDVFLKEATPKQLVTRLTEQRNEIKKTTNPTTRVYLLEQQNQVAERVIEANVASNIKEFAIRTLLRNRKSLYGLHALGSIPSQASSDSFKACFEKYLNDTNPEVYREAHICRLTYVLFEVIGGRMQSDRFTRSLEETLQRFPNDEAVMGSIRQQFDACIENDVETAKRFGEELLRSTPDKDHPAFELYSYISNRYYLIKANYKDLYFNRYANGRAGQRELEKQSLQLLQHDDCGQLVIMDVNSVANWFEGQRDTKPARNIYQTMIERGNQRSGSKAGDLLAILGNNGISRLDLIGQPMSLEGVEHLGLPVASDSFKNRVVMILFFAPEGDSRSTKYLSEFSQVSVNFFKNSAPIKSIAVPVKPSRNFSDRNLKRQDAAVSLCAWDGAERPALLKRFPVTQVPYLVMLNHEGIVTSVNVPVDEFVQEAGLLLDRR